jgi:hypothetical protein
MAVTLIAVIAPRSNSEGFPEDVRLTPETVTELGFTVTSTNEGGTAILTITGPEVDPKSCRASRSGAALFDRDDRELMVSITELAADSGAPKQVAYAVGQANRITVFFDYLSCPASVLPSRYSIYSASEFPP